LICLGSAIVIWPALVLEHAPNAWEIWRRETLGRALGEMGNNPVWFYVPFLIWLPMPWAPFAWATLRESWRAAWTRRDSKERFLWIWLFVELAILSLSAIKHKHYLMAALPVFTLWAARGLSGVLLGFQELRLRISRRCLGGLMGAGLVIGVLVLILLPRKSPDLLLPALMLGFTLSIYQCLAWLFLYRRQIQYVMAVNITCLMVSGVLVIDWVLPHFDHRVDIEAFAKDIRQHVLPTQPVCVFRMNRNPLVYHLGSPVFRAECLADLSVQLHKQSPLYVVGYEQILDELKPIVETHALARLPRKSQNEETDPEAGNLVLVKIFPREAGVSAGLTSPNAN
jgi:hypothetical protein